VRERAALPDAPVDPHKSAAALPAAAAKAVRLDSDRCDRARQARVDLALAGLDLVDLDYRAAAVAESAPVAARAAECAPGQLLAPAPALLLSPLTSLLVLLPTLLLLPASFLGKDSLSKTPPLRTPSLPQ
jgi:hypothetical protein